LNKEINLLARAAETEFVDGFNLQCHKFYELCPKEIIFERRISIKIES